MYTKGGVGGQGIPKYGGLGGDGGSVIFQTSKKESLYDFVQRYPDRRFKAADGANAS